MAPGEITGAALAKKLLYRPPAKRPRRPRDSTARALTAGALEAARMAGIRLDAGKLVEALADLEAGEPAPRWPVALRLAAAELERRRALGRDIFESHREAAGRRKLTDAEAPARGVYRMAVGE